MTEYRLGRFSITRPMLDDWEGLLPFFSKVAVVSAQSNFQGWIDYTAFSPLFEVIKLGDKIPKYQIEVTYHEAGQSSFQAIRED